VPVANDTRACARRPDRRRRMTRYAPPSSEEVIAAAERLGMTLPVDAAAMFARYGAALEFAYRRVDGLDEYLPPADPGQPSFTRPSSNETRFGVWLVKSSIKRGTGGKLAGKRQYKAHGRMSASIRRDRNAPPGCESIRLDRPRWPCPLRLPQPARRSRMKSC